MERSKSKDPVITSAEIYKRRDDVQFTSAGTMNRPKPKPKATETPAPTPAKEEAKKEDVNMEGEGDGPQISEMDVGESEA